jgi:hypothetical protein
MLFVYVVVLVIVSSEKLVILSNQPVNSERSEESSAIARSFASLRMTMPALRMTMPALRMTMPALRVTKDAGHFNDCVAYYTEKSRATLTLLSLGRIC